jgi:hypothetical protein
MRFRHPNTLMYEKDQNLNIDDYQYLNNISKYLMKYFLKINIEQKLLYLFSDKENITQHL